MKKFWTKTGKLLSLLLATCTAFTACTDETESLAFTNSLKLSFGVNQPDTRAIFNEATLPDASPVGVKLDGYNYTGLTYSGTTTSGKQTWVPNQDVVLTETSGTLYAYWPYSESIDMTAIPVDMTTADQTDWLYATPVEGINEDNASANVVMNHAAANINITINKGAYKGTGAIENITIQSDAFAISGTFNAAQAEPAFTAYEGEGEPLSRTVDITTGTATDIMVVPNGTSAAISFTATIDGIQFTATSAAVSLESGNLYQYTLYLSDINTYMTMDGLAVTPWYGITKDELTMDMIETSTVPTINSAGKANGVYVVTKDGELVDKSAAAPDCIGVAFISANQRVMIPKADATDGTNTTLYWGFNFYYQDVPNLEYLADDTAAKDDYNGKANTAAIIAGYTVLGVDMDSRDMCKVLETFNEGGYTDWYVPAAGQLHELYSNKGALNEALTAIGGTAFASSDFWSSSEKSARSAWRVNFGIDYVYSSDKDDAFYVRFVRDIE